MLLQPRDYKTENASEVPGSPQQPQKPEIKKVIAWQVPELSIVSDIVSDSDFVEEQPKKNKLILNPSHGSRFSFSPNINSTNQRLPVKDSDQSHAQQNVTSNDDDNTTVPFSNNVTKEINMISQGDFRNILEKVNFLQEQFLHLKLTSQYKSQPAAICNNAGCISDFPLGGTNYFSGNAEMSLQHMQMQLKLQDQQMKLQEQQMKIQEQQMKLQEQQMLVQEQHMLLIKTLTSNLNTSDLSDSSGTPSIGKLTDFNNEDRGKNGQVLFRNILNNEPSPSIVCHKQTEVTKTSTSTMTSIVLEGCEKGLYRKQLTVVTDVSKQQKGICTSSTENIPESESSEKPKVQKIKRYRKSVESPTAVPTTLEAKCGNLDSLTPHQQKVSAKKPKSSRSKKVEGTSNNPISESPCSDDAHTTPKHPVPPRHVCSCKSRHRHSDVKQKSSTSSATSAESPSHDRLPNSDRHRHKKDIHLKKAVLDHVSSEDSTIGSYGLPSHLVSMGTRDYLDKYELKLSNQRHHKRL